MISGANGEEGTCLGKKLLMVRALEGSGPFRRDCSFSATLTAAYPNAALLVVE